MLTFLRDHVPWLAPILVFGLVVFVHELGHFLAAKATGVYAPRFSIGFGPALWAHRWGETEYRSPCYRSAATCAWHRAMTRPPRCSRAVPRRGADRKVHRDPNAMIPFGPLPIPPDRWFESKPLSARLVIMFAGVVMNGVLAYVILAGVNLYYGRPTPSDSPVFDYVVSRIAGGGAGLTGGDSVVDVAGRPIVSWKDLVAHVAPYPGVPISITVMSHGAADAHRDTAGDTGYQSCDRCGADRREDRRRAAPRQPPPSHARAAGVVAGVAHHRNMAGLIFREVHDLATRRASLSSLSGPVGIAKISVDAARNGLEVLWDLIAFLSINVAILNLLPIPILDGGQMLVNVLEAVKGRPFSLRTREYILRVGLVAIGALFLLVMFNDRCQVFSGLC